jgi:chlorite dismutase
MENRNYRFVAGTSGSWRITEILSVVGETLPPAPHLDIQLETSPEPLAHAVWQLRGITSHHRYTTRPEQIALAAVQPGLDRPEAIWASLIPLKRTPNWWALTQDERREIFEARSGHIATGMRYLPAIARKLYHSRDLGEPFDFLTWFEYAPEDRPAFEEMLATMRASLEWQYIAREVEVRLERR